MEQRRNQDLVEALKNFDKGRSLRSFIEKNQFDLCKDTISPNLILGFFNASASIVADAMHPPDPYTKNLNVYHYIQRVGTPQKFIDALEKTNNQHILEILRDILKLPHQNSGVGGITGEILGGSGRTGYESRSGSFGTKNEHPGHPKNFTKIPHHEPSQPVRFSSLSSPGFPNDHRPFSKVFPEKSDSYDCKNVRVLFINQKFDSREKLKNSEYKKNQRYGADADREHMKNLFERTLKMKLQVEENVDSDDFHGILKRFQKKCINEGNDGCIIIMSSHGAEPHSLLMDDLEKINLEKDIIQKFGLDEFPAFDGKPKILLFNACRTEVTEDGMPKLDLFTDEDLSQVPLKYADILIGRSTVPYYASYRGAEVGSCYIKFLHDVYMENLGKEWEIRNLLEKVGLKVAATLDSRDRVQIPEVTSRLFCKNFYLHKAGVGKSGRGLGTKSSYSSLLLLLLTAIVVILAIWWGIYNGK